MTKQPKSLASFGHIRPILDAALAQSGVLYRLPSKAQAYQWRYHGYYYRKLVRMEASRLYGTDFNTTPTIYDKLVIRIDKTDPCVLRIEIHQPVGELSTLAGAALPLTRTDNTQADADLIAEARALMKEGLPDDLSE